MSEAAVRGDLFIAGDLSGIQDYVLGVSAEGKRQAKRLRARSFYVQLVSEVTTAKVMETCGSTPADLLVCGGGQFLLRARAGDGTEETLKRLRDELAGDLYDEFRGELGLTIAWDDSLQGVLRRKEMMKRRAWAELFAAGDDEWRVEKFAAPEIHDPCDICRRGTSTERRTDDDGNEVALCKRCVKEAEAGKWVSNRIRVGLTNRGAGIQVLGKGIVFDPDPRRTDITAIPRQLGRYVPQQSSFEELAEQARGDILLGVFKADVDSMGAKVKQMAEDDPTLEKLRALGADVERFFSESVQELVERAKTIYTIFSGGDDLLLIGPWDAILDLSGEIHKQFCSGPGAQYGLTLSAGIAFVKPHVPVRHAVERAEELLDIAKEEPKDRCATLGEVWPWSRHDGVLQQGKKMAEWVHPANPDERPVCGRTLLQKLLRILEQRRGTTGEVDIKAAALWAYELGRNFPARSSTGPKQLEMQRWGIEVLDEYLTDRGSSVGEVCASLRYALSATRSMSRSEPNGRIEG